MDHNKLWNIRKELGIPDHLTSLLKNLYAGQEATVRTGHGTMDWFKIGKGMCQVCIMSPCLFNLYAEYIIRNAGLDEAQAGIKITRRNINNLRYADNMCDYTCAYMVCICGHQVICARMSLSELFLNILEGIKMPVNRRREVLTVTVSRSRAPPSSELKGHYLCATNEAAGVSHLLFPPPTHALLLMLLGPWFCTWSTDHTQKYISSAHFSISHGHEPFS